MAAAVVAWAAEGVALGWVVAVKAAAAWAEVARELAALVVAARAVVARA